ncbi:MAG: DUF4474 domain-containing protein [Desulfatitalea sp.]|nr:DUF4474 domain-containing protein [Desulfatitalea sp.]NNK02891.1 DUF4474 domain-containing protein [Desulfatitalea sp.]
MTAEWKPESNLAKIVYEAGFKYDPDQDILFSRRDARQRRFGYAYAYDVAAPAIISAIIDCEPFFFIYDDKHWMIELWKGHYGLGPGGEIGVYVSPRPDPILDATIGHRPHDPDNGKFFVCAKDSERLQMSFTLNCNGTSLFSREPQMHWWLTGFKWGILSTPEQLTMDLKIGFPNGVMKEQFILAVDRAGYDNIQIDGNTVGFTFARPTTKQPRFDPMCASVVETVRKNNAERVWRFSQLGLPNSDPNLAPAHFGAYFDAYRKNRMRKPLLDVMQGHNIAKREANKALNVLLGSETPWARIIDFCKRIIASFKG